MTTYDLIRLRLHNQQLVNPTSLKAGEIVSYLGAVQAQDYLGALWSLGQRMKKAIEYDVEKAIADKAMVRTWPMRGTLHFVSPKDIRWMLKYLTPRVFARMAGLLKKQGIDNKVILRSQKLWSKALEGGKHLTREEMYEVLEKGKVSASETRGLHLLGCAAQDSLICFGPRKGKQQTFVLLDEWLPSFPMLTEEEALSELALRYFKSHGPATVEDFMWWAGLTKAGATVGLKNVESKLQAEKIAGKLYWFSPAKVVPETDSRRAYLLPTYDEYGISYKDRSAIVDVARHKTLGGLFTSAIIIDGRAVGTWRRTLKGNLVEIEIKPFGMLKKYQRESIEEAAMLYGKFLDLESRVVSKK